MASVNALSFRLGGRADEIYGRSVLDPLFLICSVCPWALCSLSYLPVLLSVLVSYKLATVSSIPTRPGCSLSELSHGKKRFSHIHLGVFFLVF